MKIKLNPDAEKVTTIRQKLSDNDEGYCHCELYYKTKEET